MALAAAEAKKYLGPVSSVFGVLSWQDAASGEKLAYIGDGLSDWFFEGKVAGVQVFANRDGGMNLTVNILEATGEAGLRAALKTAGYVFPDSEHIKALSDVMNGWKPNRELMIARLDALSAQMAAIHQNPELYGDTDENGLEAIPEDELEEWENALEERENEGGSAETVSGWPGDFYGVSLPAPQTTGKITELSSKVNGFGDEVTTIRIDGMTHQEFARYYETLTALSGWTPDGESNMPWSSYDANRDYEFDGIYGSLERIAVFFFDQDSASDLGIPQFQMFVFKTY